MTLVKLKHYLHQPECMFKEPPIDHQEKSFYTEEEESPLAVQVKSR